MLFSLPPSPVPSQEQLVTALEPLEILISALCLSPTRRSSVHDQLYIGKSGSLTGDSSNLLEFTVLCFSTPAACTRCLSEDRASGHHAHHNTSSGAPEYLEGSNFSFNGASAASEPHGLTAQALVHLTTLPSIPVWLSAFLLPAATAAVQTLDSIMLSKLLAAASHVVERVLSLKRTQTQKVALGSLHNGKKSHALNSNYLDISGSIAVHEECTLGTEASTQYHSQSHGHVCSQDNLPCDTGDLKSQSHRSCQGPQQSPKAAGSSEPQVCPEALIQAATVSCVRAQSAAQHAAAFAVLQRISGDLTVAFRQQCVTCCAFTACQQLFACVPGPCVNGFASPCTTEKPAAQHSHSQGTAVVQIRSCSDSWNFELGTHASWKQNRSRILLGARCTIQHPSATAHGQDQNSPMMTLRQGQVAEWAVTAVANAAEVFQARSGSGHNLGMHVKLYSHRSGCRNTKLLVVIVPDMVPTDHKSTYESCTSWTLPEVSSVPLRLRGSGSPHVTSVIRSADRHFFGPCDGSTGKVSTLLNETPRQPTFCIDRATTQQNISAALQSLKSLTIQGNTDQKALDNELLFRALSQIRTSAGAPVAGQLLSLNFHDVGEARCCEEFVFFDDAARSDWHTNHGISSQQTWNWWVGRVVNVFCVIDQDQ